MQPTQDRLSHQSELFHKPYLRLPEQGGRRQTEIVRRNRQRQRQRAEGQDLLRNRHGPQCYRWRQYNSRHQLQAQNQAQGLMNTWVPNTSPLAARLRPAASITARVRQRRRSIVLQRARGCTRRVLLACAFFCARLGDSIVLPDDSGAGARRERVPLPHGTRPPPASFGTRKSRRNRPQHAAFGPQKAQLFGAK